ncbi:MAG: hypothetical protein M1815_004296 [Lichina confinis]|nr:MAG: hypothetical protein M1815_004296 [Lichina confinis]
MVTRIVAAWYRVGQDDTSRWPPRPPEGDGGPNFSSFTDEEVGLLYPGSDDNETAIVNRFVDVRGTANDSHALLARKIAAEGTVLVENKGNALPLTSSILQGEDGDRARSQVSIAVVGEDAGSSDNPNACPDRSCNKGTLASGWGSGAVEFSYLVAPWDAIRSVIDPAKAALTPLLTNDLRQSDQALLDDQDICLAFVNADGGEGYLADNGIRGDRNDLYLQKGGDKLVQTVAKRCGGGNGTTIVVVHAIGPVVVENWIDMNGVKGVILANLPGQESGNSIVDILFGRVNPSGKLPYTVGKRIEDYGPNAQVLYYPNGPIPQQNFTEGLYVDYRYFDKYGIEPRYEFGYGLSYTTFELSHVSAALVKPKSTFPTPRLSGHKPPTYGDHIPPVEDTTFPKGFRRLHNYIYPYLEPDMAKNVKPRDSHRSHESEQAHPPSPAGGDEGGNPSLWDIHAEVNVTVTNTGSRTGQEVVQLYVSFPEGVPVVPGSDTVDLSSTVHFPERVLRGFDKVELHPAEIEIITFRLTRKDLSYWSTIHQNWVMPTTGRFKIHVGHSSRNLPLAADI